MPLKGRGRGASVCRLVVLRVPLFVKPRTLSNLAHSSSTGGVWQLRPVRLIPEVVVVEAAEVVTADEEQDAVVDKLAS